MIEIVCNCGTMIGLAVAGGHEVEQRILLIKVNVVDFYSFIVRAAS